VQCYPQVFGPQSLQKDLYDQAVVPIVNEVLEGFNCTIFAYGQTGTGKTYTMEGSGRKTKASLFLHMSALASVPVVLRSTRDGGHSLISRVLEKNDLSEAAGMGSLLAAHNPIFADMISYDFEMQNGELPADAGVIPRAVQQIFDTLESQNAEYSVKVTYLELYNEELTDLLAPEEFSKLAMDDKSKKPLALMEDGKGGVLVRGLEEEMVTSASEIYHLLDRGSAKRQTAETFLNKQSRYVGAMYFTFAYIYI
jgi:kinesin family protein 11